MIFHIEGAVAQIPPDVHPSAGRSQSVVTAGSLAVNLDAGTVEVAGKRVRMTGKEYQVLELLSLRKETTLTNENFMNYLYGGVEGQEPKPKIITVFICKLRKKLAAAGGDKFVETVRGRGYVLRDRANEAAA
jgi:two-component system cell cycle response regulator CtrA